jgi:dynein heavy chain
LIYLLNLPTLTSTHTAGTEKREVSAGDLEGVFTFAVTWAIGGALVAGSRAAFNEVAKSCSSAPMPENLYDAFFDLDSGRWCAWKTLVPAYVQPSPFEFSKIIVPTTENVLYTQLLTMIGRVQKPVLFVGEPGTAKTVTINNYLETLDQDKYLNLVINFSSRTTSLDVQNNIADNVDKRTGRVYGPPAGKELLVFIDDMNMPIVDTYGTQQPIALLHFLVGRGNMYDRGKELDLRIYKDLFFLAAMGPPGGGRNHVDPRFISMFNVFNLTPPSDSVLKHIYRCVVGRLFVLFVCLFCFVGWFVGLLRCWLVC